MNKNYQLLLLSLTVIFFSGCNEYQKLLKSDDPELKYSKAIEYYNKERYMQATTLFDMVASYYKGSERSDSVLNYLAKSYVGQKDYATASDYYKTYIKTYPKGKFAIESKFMVGYCYYMDSPDARLDQTSTKNAINSFQEFIEIYPESDKVQEASKLLDEMNNKLAYKEYLSAKLYYNLGDYMGNNYESAVIVAQNAMKDFPSNSYREDFELIILQSKYQQAVQSVPEKMVERYRNTIDEYYNYINEYPEGKYKKLAEKILKSSKQIVKD